VIGSWPVAALAGASAGADDDVDPDGVSAPVLQAAALGLAPPRGRRPADRDLACVGQYRHRFGLLLREMDISLQCRVTAGMNELAHPWRRGWQACIQPVRSAVATTGRRRTIHRNASRPPPVKGSPLPGTPRALPRSTCAAGVLYVFQGVSLHSSYGRSSGP
jgi:hypothetical protein